MLTADGECSVGCKLNAADGHVLLHVFTRPKNPLRILLFHTSLFLPLGHHFFQHLNHEGTRNCTSAFSY